MGSPVKRSPRSQTLQSRMTALSKLTPYRKNPRVIPDTAVAAVAASLKRFGWKQAIVADPKGVIVAGETRYKAAVSLGLTAAPVVTIPASQARAFRVIDNRTSELTSWDTDLLPDALAGLDDLDVFSFDDVLPSTATAGKTDPDVIPETPKNPVTRTGDLWELGPHRLLCGDCRDDDVVSRIKEIAIPDLLLTDPPYCSGGFQESWKSTGSIGTTAKPKQIANDRLSTRGYKALLKEAIRKSGVSFLYCFTDWKMWLNLFDVVESENYGVKQMIVWDKGTPGMGRGWRSQHELIMWATKVTPPFNKKHAATGNVIQAQRTGNTHHATQKPVSLVGELIHNTSFAQVIYDPFAGSGTTILAADQNNRQCLATDLDPAYCDVAVERWEDFTGKKAQRKR